MVAGELLEAGEVALRNEARGKSVGGILRREVAVVVGMDRRKVAPTYFVGEVSQTRALVWCNATTSRSPG